MSRILSSKNARWLAWLLVGFNLALMGTGLALQLLTNAPLLGVPFLVHFSEVAALAGFAVVGALIVSRHPRHPVGWVWLLISISFGMDHFTWGYAYYGSIAHPGSLPAPEVAIVWQYWHGRGTFGFLGMTLLLLLFPTGRPLSPRWNVLAWIATGRAVVDIPVSGLAPNPIGYFPFPTDLIAVGDPLRSALGPLNPLLAIVGLFCLLAAAFSLLLRLIRARGVERQQIKWFVYAAAFLPPAFLLIFVGGAQQTQGVNSTMQVGAFFGVTASIGMAVASALAIFRYRLWDIDIIIRRTLVYGLLTTTLALIYFLSIVLLQRIFQSSTGQQSPLSVVLSTLAIAALFTPLRRRIQDFIDRLFYRRKYDAERTLARFAAVAREKIDLSDLTVELLTSVHETVHPEHISLWVKKRGSPRQTGDGTAPD